MTAKEFQKLISGKEIQVHNFSFEQLTWRFFPTTFKQEHNPEEWMMQLFKFMRQYPEEDASGWRAHLVRLHPTLAEIPHETYLQVYEVLLGVASALQRKNLGTPVPRAFRRYFRE